MKSLAPEQPKRTISMLSLKVHVDKDDYQSVLLIDTVDSVWNVDKEELLRGMGADKAT